MWKQKQTQEAIYEGIEAVVMFMDQWIATHQLGPDEGSSQQPILPNLTLKSSEVSS